MALAAGKHVLCEKPMSLTAKNARKVFEFAQEKKLLFVEAFWSRFFPAYKQLRHELASGSIGEIKGVNASFGLKFNWETNERLQKKELGGGVTKDIGCYPVQLSCLVFGNERPEKIYVQGSLLTTGVDRCAHVMLCYKDGRTAQLTVTGDSLLPNKALIYGTNGVIEIGHPFWCPLTLTTPTKTYEYDLPKTPEPTIFRNSAGLIYEIQAVRQAILEGKSQVSEISQEDSLLIAEIQDEILQQLGVSFAESTV
jgi:dihydrodiol dehydrogenase / D-xylose 1-dehydrogenase (NADP)